MMGRLINARSATFSDAKYLLESFSQPTSDLADAKVTLWSMEEAGELIGVIGMEQSEGVRLLRSLAVSKRHQGSGLAKRLCSIVFDQVATQGISEIYLLTESASGFFKNVGFSEIARADAPDALKTTAQFSTLCPDSAKVMVRDLTEDNPA